MNKVKLMLEDLQVESFEVNPASLGTGTVRGLEVEGSGVHSQCYTHCAGGDCEPVNSVMETHCNAECPSWDGFCTYYTCEWDCGGTTIEA
jgi:hypothetical protein